MFPGADESVAELCELVGGEFGPESGLLLLNVVSTGNTINMDILVSDWNDGLDIPFNIRKMLLP